MRKLLMAIATLIATVPVSWAQTPVRMSMEECIDYALNHSHAMKNARLDVLIQEAQVKQTTAAALPHVNGKVDWNYFNKPQYSYIGASSFSIPGMPKIPDDSLSKVRFTIPYTVNAGVTVSQTIFDGSVLVALQARNTVMELARETEKITSENVRYNVYKAYNALIIARKQYNIIDRSLTLAREMQADLIKTREAGLAEKIEVDRSSVQINNLASDSMKVYNMLVISEQMLKYSIGMDINTPIVLTDTAIERRAAAAMSLVSDPVDYMQLPEYKALLIGLKLSRFDLKRYQLSALPSLNGVYTLGANTGAYYGKDVFKYDNYNEYSMFGLSLNVPLFNGFMRKNQVSEAKLKIEKTKNDIENMKQTLDFQSASARTSLKNSMLQVQSQKRNMELSESVLELAQKKYKAGVGSNLEVTTAQTEMLRAQNNYFSALLDVINAEADLKKTLGLLNK